jgi:hypothetical protein
VIDVRRLPSPFVVRNQIRSEEHSFNKKMQPVQKVKASKATFEVPFFFGCV